MDESIYRSLWFSLIGIVLFLIFAYYSRKYLMKKTLSFMGNKNIKIIDRIMIGKDKYIMVVDIYNNKYIIAVTEQQITMLKELGEVLITNQEQETPVFDSTSFSNIFKEQLFEVKERFTRKGGKDETHS